MNYGELTNTLYFILNEKAVNKDSDYISLYSIANLLEKYYQEFIIYKSKIESYSKTVINKRYSTSFNIGNFNYNENELSVYYGNIWDEIVLVKRGTEENNLINVISNINQDDLYIKNSNYYYNEGIKILESVGMELLKYYNKCLDYRAFFCEGKCVIPTDCHSFIADIGWPDIVLYSKIFKSDDDIFNSIKYSIRNSEYDYSINSTIIVNLLHNINDDLFKKIYVKISDCPEWMQDELVCIRYKELEKLKRKEKVLSLRTKVFPWIKK